MSVNPKRSTRVSDQQFNEHIIQSSRMMLYLPGGPKSIQKGPGEFISVPMAGNRSGRRRWLGDFPAPAVRAFPHKAEML